MTELSTLAESVNTDNVTVALILAGGTLFGSLVAALINVWRAHKSDQVEPVVQSIKAMNMVQQTVVARLEAVEADLAELQTKYDKALSRISRLEQQVRSLGHKPVE